MEQLTITTLNKALIEAVEQRMERLRDDISQNIVRTGKRASGRTQASLKVQTEGNSVALYGRPFFASLQYGSKPWNGATGNRMTFAGFREIIRQWVVDKGLRFGQAEEQDRTISAITASIIRKGSRQYRTATYTDVYDTLIAKAVQDISEMTSATAMTAVDVVINKWTRQSIRR